MADVDNKEPNFDPTEFKGEVSSKLEEMSAQLAEMNKQYQQSMQSIVETVTKTTAKEDVYMTEEEKRIKALEAQIAELRDNVPRQTEQIMRKERELSDTLVRLSREYPEIQSDVKMQEEVKKEHLRLRKDLQDTAEGYELAIQRAVAKKGLAPRSKRDAELDPDIAASGSRGSSSTGTSSSRGKTKISEKTLAIAQLLGRDISDPKVLEGLEKAQNRKMGRYS